MNREELIKYYASRVEHYEEALAADKRTIAWLSFARLIVFAGGLVLSGFLFKTGIAAGSFALLATAVLFALLLKLYSSLLWKKDYHTNMLEVNRAEIASVNEDYSGFDDGKNYSNPAHDFSHDIDLFGKGSVFQSLNRTCTERGEEKLAGWLLNPYSCSKSFKSRAEAIRELSVMTEWRHRFSSLGMMNLTSASETESFYRWMNEEQAFLKSSSLKLALIVLPLACILLLLLWAFSVLPASWFVSSVLLNLFLLSLRLGQINRVHVKVSRMSNYLSVASLLIEHINSVEFKSDYLSEQQRKLKAGTSTAEKEVRKLSRILNAFDSRLNMLMGVLLNGMLLWDYQCIIRIERWKVRLAGFVPGWFESIAVMDAICSLAYFANNKPDFSYPELSSDGHFLEATGMGHHLIPSFKRVTNDYLIPGSGIVNIITGANMAGKSTFLRTLAVNLILAMCGAPVCAERFRFTPVDIYTSMRTSDSLSEEESYFFAELKRLRRLVERLGEKDKPFFILDEILKGTNSKDKSEGSLAFLEKVIAMGGTGLIATHDISLGLLEKKYPDKVLNNCFEIEIDKGEVLFDFVLRKGITSKMNAALLMKQQGII